MEIQTTIYSRRVRSVSSVKFRKRQKNVKELIGTILDILIHLTQHNLHFNYYMNTVLEYFQKMEEVESSDVVTILKYSMNNTVLFYFK